MKILRQSGRVNYLYLASTNPDLEKEIIKPTIPVNFLTRGKFEDWQTPRIPLYENIDDALSAGQFLGQNLENTTIYIYRALGIRNENLLEPSITSIPYGLLLKERWYCNSIRVEKVKEIKVDKLKTTETYHYGPRSTVAKINRWKWHTVLKPWELLKLNKNENRKR